MPQQNKDNTNTHAVLLHLDKKIHEDAKAIAQADERPVVYVLRKAIERCLPAMKKEFGVAS